MKWARKAFCIGIKDSPVFKQLSSKFTVSTSPSHDRNWSYLKNIVRFFFYTIHLSWCFGMGRHWCFLWDHGGFRVFQHQTPSPKWPSWHRSNSNSHPGSQSAHPHKEKKKMTTEKALYIILQQPIRAKLYWRLLNLSFKNREATLLCFFATMWSLFGYLFIPVCIPSFFPN